MKILVIAMSGSVHTARWLSQITDQGWDIHLFPSIDLDEIHPEIQNVTVHHSLPPHGTNAYSSDILKSIIISENLLARILRIFFRVLNRKKRVKQLRRLIQELHPDIIHTLETQNAGYLMLDANKKLGIITVPWIHSIWGSDLYYFGSIVAHQQRIRGVLSHCTHLICEGKRDVTLAKSFGFTGVILPFMQATGGFNLNECKQLSSGVLPSKRKTIVLKGYQNWAGRALIALRAVSLSKTDFSQYTLVVIHAPMNSVTTRTAEEVCKNKKMHLHLIPPGAPHKQILKLYGEARISISISISDGVPNSLLESMVMGAFPIQSNTSCADEFITENETGFLVAPRDTEEISKAIDIALQNDTLVDAAAEKNLRIITNRFNFTENQKRTIEMYKNLAKRIH